MTARIRRADLFSVPGWLTLSRLGFAAWFPFLADSPGWALTVIAAAGLSDFLDGWYARRFHITSATGAILDPITDKAFATSVMVSLLVWAKLSVLEAVLLSIREIGELPLVVWLAWQPRARSMRATELGSNLLGKLTTALQFGALASALHVPSQLSWWTTATALAGAVAALAYWVKFRTVLHASVQNSPSQKGQARDGA